MSLLLHSHPIYTDYAADEAGNVWSLKFKTRRQLAVTYKDSYHMRYKVLKLSMPKPFPPPQQFTVLVHQFVYECFHGCQLWGKGSSDLTINHINGDRLDNRVANLEVLTKRENNQAYTCPTKSSPYKGVRKIVNPNCVTWETYYNLKYRGTYNTEAEAATAYDNLYAAQWGDRPNGTTPQVVVRRYKGIKGGESGIFQTAGKLYAKYCYQGQTYYLGVQPNWTTAVRVLNAHLATLGLPPRYVNISDPFTRDDERSAPGGENAAE